MNNLQQIAEYSNEVNIQAREVASYYQESLVKFEKLPELAKKILGTIGTQLPVEQQEMLNNIVVAIEGVNLEAIRNFEKLLEFTNWNIEKSQQFIEDWQNQIN
jgi:hypothetical protein